MTRKVLLPLLIAVALIALVLIVEAAGTLLAAHYHGTPVTSWQEYNFSFRERRQLQKRAEHCDYDAAFQLGMYYERLTHDDKKAAYWLKVAAAGNHVEANRTLIKQGLYHDSVECKKIMEECVQRLKELASSEQKPENFYMADLDLQSEM